MLIGFYVRMMLHSISLALFHTYHSFIIAVFASLSHSHASLSLFIFSFVMQ